jgi:MoaA/NifB/PqqE/SkfB family radical SAM enzyme
MLNMNAIEITTRIGCKNACVYCPQEQLMKTYSTMRKVFLLEFEVFQEFLMKIPPNVRICFSGMCEPWANPECTKMVLHSHESGHRVSVFTTLTGMTPADVQQVKELPFDTFVVHLPSNEGYEQITVDDSYLEVLRCLSDSSIVTQWLCLGETVHPVVERLLHTDIDREQLFTRAGNIKIKNRSIPGRKKGRIRCERNLRQNVLLPSGDVLLCCMDYGMKHILGNLKEQDYESLFESNEFLLVQRGQVDASHDILCRYCDCFVRDVDLRAKVSNNLLNKLKFVRRPDDVLALVPEIITGLKKHFLPNKALPIEKE